MWYTPAEELSILNSVGSLPDVSVSQIGTSAGGRPVRLTVVGSGDVADVMFLGMQHGNEPAGRHGLLDTLKAYTEGDPKTVALLNGLTVAFICTVNPDGAVSGQRRNDANVDLNREWLRFNEPEARAVGEVMRDWRPRAAVDLHETLGGITPSHVEYRATNHRSGHPPTRQLGLELRDRLISLAEDNGWISGPYLGPVSPLTNFDGTSILRHQISLIVESNRASAYNAEDRVLIQRQTINETLAWIGERYDVIEPLRDRADEWATGQGENMSLVWLGSHYASPTPLGYTMTAATAARSEWHRSSFWITPDTEEPIVPLAGPWWPIAPFLFDPEASGPFIGQRYYPDPEEGEDEDEGQDPDDPDEERFQREALAVARPREGVTWLACDAISGRVIEELPHVGGSIGRVLGGHTSSTLSIGIPSVRSVGTPLDRQVATVLRATEPARAMIVAVINDIPAWGGLVMQRESSSDDDAIGVSCVTSEGYFERRTIGDRNIRNGNQNTVIARWLIEHATGPADRGRGLPMSLDIVRSRYFRDMEYERSERTSVYRALTELSDMDDGPEWTIELDWADDQHTAITRVVRVVDRIGRTTPAAMFDTQGSSATGWSLTEDYSEGRYANWVEAYGQGEGDDQPSSAPQRALNLLDAGIPIYEHHFQADSNNRGELNALARVARDRLRDGAQLWSITSRWNQYPRFGVDWMLGDEVGFDLAGHRFPYGHNTTGRIIGWELDLQTETIELTLYDPTGGSS